MNALIPATALVANNHEDFYSAADIRLVDGGLPKALELSVRRSRGAEGWYESVSAVQRPPDPERDATRSPKRNFME